MFKVGLTNVANLGSGGISTSRPDPLALGDSLVEYQRCFVGGNLASTPGAMSRRDPLGIGLGTDQHHHSSSWMMAYSKLVVYSCPHTSRKEVPRSGIDPGTL